MFRRCLICTNFSDGLQRLVNFVPDLAKSGLECLVFFHSFPVWEQESVGGIDKAKIAAAKEKLSPALENLPEGVEVRIEVVCGNPVEDIINAAETYQIDVILVASSNKNPLEQRLLGNINMDLARRTSIPLMIMRPQLISVYTQEELSLRCQHLWRYLLIPYHDSKAAKFLLKRIKEYVKQSPHNSLQQCLLLWVVEEKNLQPTLNDNRQAQAREQLNQAQAELEALGVTVTTEIREGDVVEEVVKMAVEYDITAIAVANYHNNLLEWLMSNVTDDIRYRIWFPLLFFSR